MEMYLVVSCDGYRQEGTQSTSVVEGSIVNREIGCLFLVGCFEVQAGGLI